MQGAACAPWCTATLTPAPSPDPQPKARASCRAGAPSLLTSACPAAHLAAGRIMLAPARQGASWHLQASPNGWQLATAGGQHCRVGSPLLPARICGALPLTRGGAGTFRIMPAPPAPGSRHTAPREYYIIANGPPRCTLVFLGVETAHCGSPALKMYAGDDGTGRVRWTFDRAPVRWPLLRPAAVEGHRQWALARAGRPGCLCLLPTLRLRAKVAGAGVPDTSLPHLTNNLAACACFPDPCATARCSRRPAGRYWPH